MTVSHSGLGNVYNNGAATFIHGLDSERLLVETYHFLLFWAVMYNDWGQSFLSMTCQVTLATHMTLTSVLWLWKVKLQVTNVTKSNEMTAVVTSEEEWPDAADRISAHQREHVWKSNLGWHECWYVCILWLTHLHLTSDPACSGRSRRVRHEWRICPETGALIPGAGKTYHKITITCTIDTFLIKTKTTERK